MLLFIFTVRQYVDTTAYLFARDGVFLQNAYWLLTYPDTDTTAARTCLTEGSSTAAVIFIKEVDGHVLEPVSVRSLTPHLVKQRRRGVHGLSHSKKKRRLRLENYDVPMRLRGCRSPGEGREVGEIKKEAALRSLFERFTLPFWLDRLLQ